MLNFFLSAKFVIKLEYWNNTKHFSRAELFNGNIRLFRVTSNSDMTWKWALLFPISHIFVFNETPSFLHGQEAFSSKLTFVDVLTTRRGKFTRNIFPQEVFVRVLKILQSFSSPQEIYTFSFNYSKFFKFKKVASLFDNSI